MSPSVGSPMTASPPVAPSPLMGAASPGFNADSPSRRWLEPRSASFFDEETQWEALPFERTVTHAPPPAGADSIMCLMCGVLCASDVRNCPECDNPIQEGDDMGGNGSSSVDTRSEEHGPAGDGPTWGDGRGSGAPTSSPLMGGGGTSGQSGMAPAHTSQSSLLSSDPVLSPAESAGLPPIPPRYGCVGVGVGVPCRSPCYGWTCRVSSFFGGVFLCTLLHE